MRVGRSARHRGRRTWTFPGRANQQDPPRRGRSGPTDVDPDHPRPSRRQPQLLPLLNQISVARAGRGRPRQRPDQVIADKAYSHPSTRAALRARRIAFTCPEGSDQIARRQAKGTAGGRPPRFDADTYRNRNLVERCFARLKQFRDLATRYAKRLAYWRSELIIAAIILWLR